MQWSEVQYLFIYHYSLSIFLTVNTGIALQSEDR